MNERDALLVLNAVEGLGNAGIRKLLERYGAAATVLSLNERDLSTDPVICAKAAQNIFRFPGDRFVETEYALMSDRQVKIVTYMDDDYPALLRETADAPVVLYVKGDLSLCHPLSMAIVGSRKASFYGIEVSRKFAAGIAQLGFTVISGMARGIDTAAHQGALRGGGATIAVLGCGLSHVYPPENNKLFDQIAGAGAVISEFPMGAKPLPHNFPRRNRIISGLSLGVIVVEAARRSGALITAGFALEQGRDVFAVPGRIDHPASGGVHNLIQQGAKLVTSMEDILEDLEPRISAYLARGRNGIPEDTPPAPDDTADRLRELSEEERLVFNHLTDRPVHVDELADRCGPAVPVMSVLFQLELKRLAKQLPGKLFVR